MKGFRFEQEVKFLLYSFICIYMSFASGNWTSYASLRTEFRGNQGFSKQITIADITGIRHNISLWRSDICDARGYFVKYRNGQQLDPVTYQYQTPQECHYVGHSEGNPRSQVSINVCGQSGTIFDGQTLRRLKYDNNEWEIRESTAGGHHNVKRETCLCLQNSKRPSTYWTEATNHSLRKRSLVEVKLVELYVVMDHTLYNRIKLEEQMGHGPSPLAYIEDMVRNINMIYDDYSVRTVLIGVEIWNQSDPFSLKTDATLLLNDFLEYSRQNIVGKTVKQDVTVLISGLTFDSHIVGMAYVGGMCGPQSGAVIMDDNTALDRAHKAAVTLAHEMGHTMGLIHDYPSCSCRDAARGCLMNASIILEPTELSSCSKASLEKFFHDGGGACLYDKPEVVYQGPVCGNGIRERGEVCDCGSKHQCKTSQCCLHGCKLKRGAECNDGGCCKNCKIQNACTLCRPALNDCDLDEFCDGASEQCPDNLYKRDYSDCGKGQDAGKCYRGKCRSNYRQCQYIWGQDGEPNNKACFEFNVNGDASGNCGTKSKSPPVYYSCNRTDVMCGMIYCSSSRKYPVIGGPQTILNTKINLPNGTSLSCRSAAINLGDDVPDPGLVYEGSPCETDRKIHSPGICLGRKCVPMGNIRIKTCPKDPEGKECSGSGICNNLGECWCELGYKQPDCSQSYDPCPEKVPESGAGLPPWLIGTICAAAVLLTLAAIVPIICIVRYKRKNRVRQLGTKASDTSHTGQTENGGVPKKVDQPKHYKGTDRRNNKGKTILVQESNVY